MHNHGSNKIRYDLVQLAKRLNSAKSTTKDEKVKQNKPKTKSQQAYHKVGEYKS